MGIKLPDLGDNFSLRMPAAHNTIPRFPHQSTAESFTVIPCVLECTERQAV